ncbi:hypothetical protein [Alkaliphilus peptidifermentans]|uniref:Lipoprotein n=1 Tax=Alkaliphilus peptidifermentans DSM 18978 TaxID=1120976 RepID=A0A1G5KNC2_9FIRM|nr:hypothetical protein [Alkaliphilus peptidifermentans]SCZ02087.1 hypothetical protein SAMN03080606_03631 [Alkaliphilus peptidifermentans DSM 18978]
MNRIKIGFLLIFIIFFSIGCVSTDNYSNQQIIPPNNLTISVQGTWEITNILNQQSTEEKSPQQWIGRTLQFSSEFAVMGEELLTNPRYQIKRVDAEEYLFYHLKAFPETFRFSDKEVDVITITDQDRFYCEVLKQKDDELVLKIYNDSFIIKKISTEVDSNIVNMLNEGSSVIDNVKGSQEDELLLTGVLVGLRSTPQKTGTAEHVNNYRTLWISAKNKQLQPLAETEDLFFPRRSGFWKLEVKSITDNGRTEEFPIAYNILAREDNPIHDLIIDPELWEGREGRIYREVNYVGNDYVSIEETAKGIYQGGEEWKEKHLKILAIDSLPNIKGVDIFDLLGAAGIEAMDAGIQRLLEERVGDKIIGSEVERDNFGLERRLGHWFFKGKVNYMKNQESFSADYNINLIPPSKLIFYDELSVPWTNAKDKIPSTVDLYTSPNKDIAIVVTKKELMVYGIDGGKLQQEPLQRITLRENETVIMAEWAIGHYVENWNKTLNNYINKSR